MRACPAPMRSRESNGRNPPVPSQSSWVLSRPTAGKSKTLERKASLRKVTKLVPAPTPSPAPSRAIVTARERKINQMLELAEELGYSCTSHEVYLKDLATNIAAHLRNRSGLAIYQTACWSEANFPLDLARQLFAMASVQPSTSPGTTTWCCVNMQQVDAVFGSIFEDHHRMCFGATKALQAPSEPVIRVLATIMPGVEISHVVLARGVMRLQINLMYVLFDEDGEMHPPKDNQRREMDLQQHLISELSFARKQRRMRRAWPTCGRAAVGGVVSPAGQLAGGADDRGDGAQLQQPPHPGQGQASQGRGHLRRREDHGGVRGKWALVEWKGCATRGRTQPHTLARVRVMGVAALPCSAALGPTIVNRFGVPPEPRSRRGMASLLFQSLGASSGSWRAAPSWPPNW